MRVIGNIPFDKFELQLTDEGVQVIDTETKEVKAEIAFTKEIIESLTVKK